MRIYKDDSNPVSSDKLPPVQPSGKSDVPGPEPLPIKFPSSENTDNVLKASFEAKPISLSEGETILETDEKFLKEVVSLDDSVRFIQEGMSLDPPSLDEIVNQWGNEEVSLLYHEYVGIKQKTGGVWKAADGFAAGLGIGEKAAGGAVLLTQGFRPDVASQFGSIEEHLDTISLAYKIPSGLGKVAIMIYKRIFLDKAQQLLDKDPPGMTTEQKKEFQQWLTAEKKEISDAAKRLAIKHGKSLPSDISKVLKLCEFNTPFLKLGLAWVGAALDPIIAGYDIYKAAKKTDVIEQDIGTFKAENFRTSPDPTVRDLLKVVEDRKGPEPIPISEIVQEATERLLQEQASAVADKRRDALLAFRAQYQIGFESLIGQITDDMNIAGIREYLEENGLTLDPRISSPEEFMLRLKDDTFKDNMLARYIDSHSNQPMNDTVRNGLKALTIKKQSAARRSAFKNLLLSKVKFTATLVTSITTVALTTLAVIGGVSIPMIAFAVPVVGMLAVGTVCVFVGLIKFYQRHPNLFREYVKGSFVKMALYNIPKGIQELRKNMTAVKVLKNSLARRKLMKDVRELPEDDLKLAQAKARLEKLQDDAKVLEERIYKIEGKIADWERKIQPIATGVMVAKWMDFLREGPSRKDGYSQKETEEMLKGLVNGLAEGSIPFDDEVVKIVKERLGVDLRTACGPETAAAVLNFAL